MLCAAASRQTSRSVAAISMRVACLMRERGIVTSPWINFQRTELCMCPMQLQSEAAGAVRGKVKIDHFLRLDAQTQIVAVHVQFVAVVRGDFQGDPIARLDLEDCGTGNEAPIFQTQLEYAIAGGGRRRRRRRRARVRGRRRSGDESHHRSMCWQLGTLWLEREPQRADQRDGGGNEGKRLGNHRCSAPNEVLLGRWLTLRIKPMGLQILVNPLLCQPGLLRGWFRWQRLGRRRRWAGLVLLSLGQHPNLKDA